MPVEDHATHASTVKEAGRVYGCHNRPRKREPMAVKDGHSALMKLDFSHKTVAYPVFRVIEDFGSPECRYDKSLTDQSCKGCQHAGSGEAYSKQVQERGK